MRQDTSVTDPWDVYWRGVYDASSPVEGGVRHPVIRKFWVESLSSIIRDGDETTLVDIACGDGAILDILNSIDPRVVDRVTCVDSSTAAIASIGSRFPDAKGIVANAAAIPFRDRSFALVTSQFGVEYAGRDAFKEAARLVAPGGRMILLMHMPGSTLQRECQAALDAISAIEQCEFIPLASRMFEAGFAALQGADRHAYDSAAARLDPAVRKVEEIIASQGEQVAGGTVAVLYSGVASIHAEIQHYKPGSVLDWLSIMDRELKSFAGRMASMNRAVLSETEYAEIRKRIQDCGHTVHQDDRLSDSAGRPLGWLIIAEASK